MSPEVRPISTRSPRRTSTLANLTFRWAVRCAYPVARIWWWLTHPHVRGAYVAMWRMDASGQRRKLLVLRNTYKPGLTVPGGGIGRNETPMQAALRELREEVGLDLPADRLQPTRDFVIDYMHRRDHVYFFNVDLAVDEAADPQIDGREVIWADFVPCAELRAEELVPPLRRYLSDCLGTTPT